MRQPAYRVGREKMEDEIWDAIRRKVAALAMALMGGKKGKRK